MPHQTRSKNIKGQWSVKQTTAKNKEGPIHSFLGVLSVLCLVSFPILFSFRDINQTSCEARGCCYQELNLEYNGGIAPVCHRRIPSIHSLRVISWDHSNSSEVLADVQYSHPQNLNPWPFTNLTQELETYTYRLKRMAENHYEISFFKGNKVFHLIIGESFSSSPQ